VEYQQKESIFLKGKKNDDSLETIRKL